MKQATPVSDGGLRAACRSPAIDPSETYDAVNSSPQGDRSRMLRGQPEGGLVAMGTHRSAALWAIEARLAA